MERPNLKICIENDGDSESDEDKPIIEVFEDTKLSSEASGDDKTKTLEEWPALNETDSLTTLEVSLDHKTLQQPKRYQNKAGEFVTGFDPLSKEYKELREKRAERFGIKDNKNVVSDEDLKTLYESLGISEEAFESGERGIRLDAIHLRGVDNMSTQDVFKYFQEFAPGSLEWIDDTSCNVVWVDRVTAARAMIHMSRAVDNNNFKRKKDQVISGQGGSKDGEELMDVDGDKENGTLKSAHDKQPSEKAEEFDYDLNLMSESEDSDVEMTDSHKGAESATESQTSEQSREKLEKQGMDNIIKTGEMETKRKIVKFHTKKKYPMPPGKWRVGLPYLNKAGVIYMRYATKADKKQPGAGKRSLYYRKYGNPNFQGMKGLISESRKRKLLASRYHQEELEAKKAVMKAKKVTDISEETAFDKHVQEALKTSLKSRLEPRALEHDASWKSEHSTEEDDFSNLEDELHILLSEASPPPKKRTMRMYADDIEEELNKSRSLTPHFTESAIQSRLQDARGLVGDARSRINGRRLAHNSDSQTSVGDLRNILGRKRRQGDLAKYKLHNVRS